MAASSLKSLKKQEPEFANPVSSNRFMLLWDQEKRLRELVEFDLERAIAKVSVPLGRSHP